MFLTLYSIPLIYLCFFTYFFFCKFCISLVGYLLKSCIANLGTSVKNHSDRTHISKRQFSPLLVHIQFLSGLNFGFIHLWNLTDLPLYFLFLQLFFFPPLSSNFYLFIRVTPSLPSLSIFCDSFPFLPI